MTSLWVTEDWLDTLAIRCDGSHTHKSWRPKLGNNKQATFPTASEAAYPQVLCDRILQCIKQVALDSGAHDASDMMTQGKQPDNEVTARIVMGVLPRGVKVEPLVAEFGHYIAAVSPPQQPKLIDDFLAHQLKGARVTSRQVLTRGKLRVSSDTKTTFLGDSEFFAEHEMVEMAWIGIPSEPEEFVQRAVQAGHPRSLDVHVNDEMKRNIRCNFLEPPFLLAKRRVDFFKFWGSRAKETKDEEERLRSGMPEHARKILGDKRLVLFKSILKSLDYPDVSLIDDVAQGFRLSGYMPKSHVFRPRTKRPSMTLETLKKLSSSFNHRTFSSLKQRQDEGLEKATWDETQSEIEKGWIFVDNDSSFTGKFVGRRFGITQGSKIRVIDDCTSCGLNWTVGLHEKFKLHSVDFLAAMMSCALTMVPSDAGVSVRGRCYDLKSAYKQFAVHPDDQATLRMGVNSPSQDEPVVIGFNALPFGAVGSVAGFLRVSHAVWYIGFYGLGILWSAFYDDFSVISRVELESSASWACEELFNLLGLKFATEGKKCLPFSSTFKMLGLQIDTSKFQEGAFLIDHTPERRDELNAQISSTLDCGTLEIKAAERLRGRMIFFEGYTFGRVANSAVKSLGRYCLSACSSNVIDDDLKRSLLFLKDRVLGGGPLVVEKCISTTWFVFTDGACSPETMSGSIGGILVSPSGVCVKYFGASMPSEFMKELFSRSKNPIHELEVLPVALAAELWGSVYAKAQVVYYIDNESARMAYIKGVGETQKADLIIRHFAHKEFELQHRVWFARIPSHSNPSDAPSRLNFEWIEKTGATRTNFSWEMVSRLLHVEVGRSSEGD